MFKTYTTYTTYTTKYKNKTDRINTISILYS